MYKFVLLLTLGVFVLKPSLFGQTSFSDDFSDGDFSTNPTWVGETTNFQVNANNQLQFNHLSPTSTNFSSLVTSSTIIDSTTWEFYVKLDFDPSASNFIRVYLVSDQQDLTQPLNGYFVQVGGQSGTVDDVSLYRQDSTTTVKIIDGSDGTVAVSPEVRIRVTKKINQEWELFLDQAATGSAFMSEGTVLDSIHRNSSYFGVFCRFTSSRSDKFFFDDFVVSNAPFQDTIPPVLTSTSVTSSTSLDLSFNEPVDVSTALSTSNYVVDKGIGNPNNVQFLTADSSTIQLTFAIPFANGENYTLITKNITDTAGNVLIEDTSSFSYFVPVPAQYRDLVINEIYPDFSPSNGLPEAEFIELFNASKEVFQLDGWIFSDGTLSATLGSQFIKPGEYLILCSSSDIALFSPFGTTLGVSNFPSLNNAGDHLQLFDPTGLLVDEVNYTDNWYRTPDKDDGGYTLEQINPITPCIGSINFIASNNTIGGTPGAQNSVFDTLPETIAPVILSAIVLSPDSVLLQFSELLDTNSVSTAQYVLNSSLIIDEAKAVEPGFSSVLLTLLTPLDSGVVYDISVSGIMDCSGNAIETNRSSIVLPDKAKYRGIVINEIYTDTTPSFGLPSGEFVELFNTSSSVLQLKDWSFSDGSSTTILMPQIVMPGEFIILCSQADTALFSLFGNTLGVSNFPDLNNSGDHLQLFDPSGLLIDEVNYTNDWYRDLNKDDGGYTLEQINPLNLCSGPFNFIASNNTIGGTPGTINSAFDTSVFDTAPPLLVSTSTLSSDSILLNFNEPLDTNSVLSAQYLINPTVTIDEVTVLDPYFTTVLLILQTPLDSGIIYAVSVSGVTDCSGNEISDGNHLFIALPENVDSNDLVINEILFNPKTGGVDFVELFNRSEKVIGLNNLQIANEEDSVVANIENITDEALVLLPKSYLVLTENKETVLEQYPLGVADRILEIDNLPSYNDNEGGVYLLNSQTQIIDHVRYTEDQHFALLQDDDGVSLERISADRPSTDLSNFHSASETIGFATPGYENSQAFEDIHFSGEITVEPSIFSPDNDGFQDVLNINYLFSAPGFVASISIFDRNGRLIKRLVQNELLGSSGTFSWDGITDDNFKARIGVYVILVEAFNTNGNQEVFKEVVTVAGNLD